MTQKQTHKAGGVKTTKFTDKKTGKTKTLIERVKPSQPKPKRK